MTKIKKIMYFPPTDIINDALDVLIIIEDDYCTDGYCYFVEVTTPQFLSTIIERENHPFLLPDYPSIIVSKLTDDIIRAAIQAYIDTEDDSYWLKLYNIVPKLKIKEINEILYKKRQEEIELAAELDAELENESDPKD